MSNVLPGFAVSQLILNPDFVVHESEWNTTVSSFPEEVTELGTVVPHDLDSRLSPSLEGEGRREMWEALLFNRGARFRLKGWPKSLIVHWDRLKSDIRGDKEREEVERERRGREEREREERGERSEREERERRQRPRR